MSRARRLRSHLTYANVMATLAVFIALGGGAYAVSNAPKNSVTSSSIANGQVKSADVANNGLTGKDVKESSLTGVGGGGPPSGPAGGDLSGNYPKPQIGPGAVGANALGNGSVGFSKLGTIIPVTTNKQLTGTGIDSDVVTCPAGTWAIRGGGGVFEGTAPVEASVPYTSANGQVSGWQINTGSGNGTLIVNADCLR